MSWGSLAVEGSPVIAGLWAIGTLVVLIQVVRWGWVRSDTRFRRVRVGATMIAVFSIFVLGLQPTWLAPAPASNEAILVTEGANASTMRLAYDSLGVGMPVYSLIGRGAWADAFDSVRSIGDVGVLQREYPELSRLFVAGYGLPGYDWALLQGIQVVLLPSSSPSGITTVQWMDEVTLGQSWVVQGRFAENWSGTMYLEGRGGVVDSLVLEAGDRFMLTDRPREAGRFLYTLHAEPAGEHIPIKETMGVSVVMPERLNVLILESAPGFETRTLRDWLSEKGYGVAIRSKISTDRYRTDLVNMPASTDLSRIRSETLTLFDILLLDRRTMNDLSASERKQVQAAIRETGLGLLLAAPGQGAAVQATARRDGLDPFLWDALQGGREQTDVLWDNRPVAEVRGISRAPYSFREDAVVEGVSGRILFRNADSDPIARWVQRGRGRIAVSLVEETFPWVLQGESDLYDAYWSHTFSELAQPAYGDVWQWSRETPLRVSAPIPLTLITPVGAPAARVAGPGDETNALPLRQDPILSGQWQSVYWPHRAGWHAFLSQQDTAWAYVYPDSEWTSVYHHARHLETTRHHVMQGSIASRVPTEVPLTRHPVPMVPFYVLLLASCIVLWVEHTFP